MEQIQLTKLDNNSRHFSQTENEAAEEDSDFLILTKEEKILSKVLLRNILYSDNQPLPNNNNNENKFHTKISQILLNNFNFSESDSDNNKFNYDNYTNKTENSLIFKTPKKFFIDWTSSKLQEGKFSLKISTQSKNIIFEDLFTPIKHKKEKKISEISVLKNSEKSQSESDSDFFSSEEDAEFSDIDEKLKELNYPSDFFNFSDTNKTSKFNFEINFDRKKPNQVLFFCEKLFINDIISAEDLAYIKTLAPISNRNFKFSQNQNLLGNQFSDFSEVIKEIRILEKIEGLDGSLVKLKIDLNLNYQRKDHKFATKILLNFSDEKKFAYVISNNEDIENLRKIPFLGKCDSGEFLENFIENLSKENYNKNFKLFLLNKDRELLINDNHNYENLLEKIGEKNSLSFFNSVEEMEKEIFEFCNPSADIKLTKGNFVEVPLGYLNFDNEILKENFVNVNKAVFNEVEKLRKNSNVFRPGNKFVKNVSIFVEDTEFRFKDISKENLIDI